MPTEEVLTSSEQAMLSARADGFHSALRRGEVSDWQPHLTGLEGPVRSAVLVELAMLDMGHRWRSGERVAIEDYLRRFPELGPAEAVSPKLISEEFRCRVAAGDTIDLNMFQSRFPIQFPAIRSQLAAIKPPEIAATPAKGTAAGGVAGEFEFIRKLGQGVFGEVWLAKKKTSGIEKAIKILLQAADHEAAIRELRSLELIKNLRHPYLLATEDFWISGDRLHVVMELAEGTLRGRMKECQTTGLPGIPEPELFRFVAESAEGLDYLHEQKITHRDVKPDNILILRGHAKVADFGLARMQDQIMSQMSVFAGTPAYMGPEVWGGEGGPASDQYSLAATYVELRQGKSALKLGPLPEMMIAHMEGRFVFSDFIPEDEQDVLRRAMAQKPEDRYANCSFFMEALAMASGRSISRFAPPSGKAGSGSHPSLPTIAPGVTKERSGPIPVSGARTWGAAKPSGSFSSVLRDPPAPAAAVPPKYPSKPLFKAKPKPPASPKVAIVGFLLVCLVGAVAVALFLSGGAPTTTATTIVTDPPTTGTSVISPIPPIVGMTDKPISLPACAKPEPGSPVVDILGERRAYQWVTINCGAETMRFRLIPGGAPGDVKPFYIGEYKVWVGYYRAGGGAPVRETDPLKPADAGEPLMNVTASEAAAFIGKLAPGEGMLPTPTQWDHASGLHRPPTRTNIAIDGSSPIVGVARPAVTRGRNPPADSNDLGLKDMAGNGREWTGGVFVAPGVPWKPVGVGGFEPGDRAILRGRNFTLPTPLSIGKLAGEVLDPQGAYAGKASPYTGFRIALSIP